jgi:hypothetical protein
MGHFAALVLGVALIASTSARASEDESVVQEMLGILKERGIVDQEEYERLALQNASYEQKKSETFLSRIQWSGDARLRLENFWYDEDELGNEQDDRTRFRYRLRIGALAPVHEHVDVGFRLASGEDDLRSTNQSAGRNDEDFDPDSIFIDQAFVTLRAPNDWLGDGGSLKATGGKIANPFLWKHSKDYMLWDPDINPEGGAIQLEFKPAEPWALSANTGYFVLDENTTASDPHVFGVQGGFGVTPIDTMELGARASWYEWHSLDADFFGRGIDGTGGSTPAAGNLAGGLTDGSSFGAGELAAYLEYAGIADWPIRVFGHYARNFDAEDALGADEENTGWGAGLEIGDPKKFVLLGTGYYELEANFWPSQFTDGDLFDGVTNRKGWTVYAARQLFTNTELNLTLSESDEIEDDLPPFDESVANADRFRLQTDLVFKF